MYMIVMVDVDYFKCFNDIYGYDIGDDVLWLVVVWLVGVGGGGWVFCYGGEEFVLVFLDCIVLVCVVVVEVIWVMVEDVCMILCDCVVWICDDVVGCL